MSEEILSELASYGNRKLLLWELASDGRSFIGVDFVAAEHGLEDAPLEHQVRVFAVDMLDDGEIRDEYDQMADWDALEENYGDRADQYL